jgi:hypothetical protein
MNFYVLYLQYMYSTPFVEPHHIERGTKMEEAERDIDNISAERDEGFVTINLEEGMFNFAPMTDEVVREQ